MAVFQGKGIILGEWRALRSILNAARGHRQTKREGWAHLLGRLAHQVHWAIAEEENLPRLECSQRTLETFDGTATSRSSSESDTGTTAGDDVETTTVTAEDVKDAITSVQRNLDSFTVHRFTGFLGYREDFLGDISCRPGEAGLQSWPGVMTGAPGDITSFTIPD